jgi:hypothetical protein
MDIIIHILNHFKIKDGTVLMMKESIKSMFCRFKIHLELVQMQMHMHFIIEWLRIMIKMKIITNLRIK